MATGYIHVLASSTVPLLSEIVTTELNSKSRESLLLLLGVPGTFYVYYSLMVPSIEGALHETKFCLEAFKSEGRRNFFRVEPRYAVEMIEKLKPAWFDETLTEVE